ncbi:MAG: hypothetical protein DDT22_00302 [candidate division WS2 bacterium]|nr:hypothetical protein [Candidatus Lithacetigena glycinireducens]
MKALCARNSYLDFVKAEQVARYVASELMKIEETLLKELETTVKKGVEDKIGSTLWGIYISAAILTSLLIFGIIEPPESFWDWLLLPFLAALLPLIVIILVLGAIFVPSHIQSELDHPAPLSMGLMVFSGIVLPIILLLLGGTVAKIPLKAIRNSIEKIKDVIKKLSAISAKE